MNELPARPELPDVMTMADGRRRVSTAAQWKQRRQEMKRLLAYYAVGLMPPPPRNVKGTDRATRPVLGGKAIYRLVHLSFGPKQALGFDVAVFVPAARRGPVPTIIFPSFGPAPGAAPLPLMTRPPEQGKGLDALTVPLGDQLARAAAAAASLPSAAAAPGAIRPPAGAPTSDPEG